MLAHWRRIAALSVVVAIGGACSGSKSSSSSLPHGPAATAALAAYRAWWGDYSAATRVYPVDPSEPGLAVHMQPAELTKIQAQLSYMKVRQQYIKGPLVDTSKAEVTQLGPSSATVVDCYLDLSYLVNGTSGAIENQPNKDRVLARISLTLDQGEWKVANFMTVKIGCISAV